MFRYYLCMKDKRITITNPNRNHLSDVMINKETNRNNKHIRN